MKEIRIKVRDQEIFLNYIIPDYVLEAEWYSFDTFTKDLMKKNKMPEKMCTVYEVQEDDTLTWEGEDDGYGEIHNRIVNRMNEEG